MNLTKGSLFSLERMISIALDLSAEKDFNMLMRKILLEAMDTCNCDAGTVYLLEGEHLHFHTLFTKSKGIPAPEEQKKSDLPPVPLVRTHVCACCAMDKKKINLPDIYESTEYDFKGAQKYDAINNYRTGSMLVIPMSDEKDDVIGVLQLINAMDDTGRTIPFDKDLEEIVQALASLAAVSINNHKLAQEINDLLHSFVQVMVDAIDTRSSYNANHTRSMVRYGNRFINWLNENDRGWKFNPDEKEVLLMSVWLHDIGKLLVPADVLDKANRLQGIEEGIRNRVEIGCLKEEIDALKDPANKDVCLEKAAKLKEAFAAFKEADQKSFLDNDMVEKINAYAKLTCQNAAGEQIPLLTEKERKSLTVQKGTLTEEEKGEVEKHVVYTQRLLEKMNFRGVYKDVPRLAGAHHEYIDGSGYPHHVGDGALSKENRLITILDIYDALTAEDRPYKPAIPSQKAFSILYAMCEEGKLDKDIVSLFEESGAWNNAASWPDEVAG